MVGIKAIFDKYKRLHKNSVEEFDPTLKNVLRWMRANRVAEENASMPESKANTGAIDVYRMHRSVQHFDQFPEQTKMLYLTIAMAYPGFQVYACGSRVRGCYIDFMADDYHGVKKAREMAGMKNKLTSDFDYWVDPAAVAKITLPDCCERVRCRVDLKLPIPVYNG